MIQLQFSAGNNLPDAIIKWKTDGPFTHVDAVLPETGWLIGARLGGDVKTRRPDYKIFTKKLVISLPCSDEISSAFYKGFCSQIGKPYDKSAIKAMVFGKWINRDWREQDSWYCSDIVQFYLEKSKYFEWPLCMPPTMSSPNSLLYVLSGKVKVEI